MSWSGVSRSGLVGKREPDRFGSASGQPFARGCPSSSRVMLLGFWTFVYNVGRTLRSVPSYDVTERHFGLALGFLVLVTALGFLLALDLVRPVFSPLSIPRAAVVGSHATLAVFGAVLTTVLGALYQLATMFTGTELHGIDVRLRRFEEVAYPAGVLLLAVGRQAEVGVLARLGGVLIVVSLLGFSLILGRRLHETRVDWTPILSRYAVVAPAMALWAVLALQSWIADPLARATLFGAPGTVHLLVLGVIGFVVLGTLYHVVRFIVWVHRYSDRLGYGVVPTVGDRYSDRVAPVDFAPLAGGTGIVVTADPVPLPSPSSTVGGLLALTGALLFLANVLRAIREHSPHSIAGILSSRPRRDPNPSSDESMGSADSRETGTGGTAASAPALTPEVLSPDIHDTPPVERPEDRSRFRPHGNRLPLQEEAVHPNIRGMVGSGTTLDPNEPVDPERGPVFIAPLPGVCFSNGAANRLGGAVSVEGSSDPPSADRVIGLLEEGEEEAPEAANRVSERL